ARRASTSTSCFATHAAAGSAARPRSRRRSPRSATRPAPTPKKTTMRPRGAEETPMDPTTIDPLLSVLPPAWFETLQAYAPHVLVWLLALTALVHLLVPVSRAVERWAIASSVTWDDEPARRFAELV